MIRKTLGSLFVTPVSTRRNSMLCNEQDVSDEPQSGENLSVLTYTLGFNKETI